jgi:hypothetical protein
MDKGKLGLLMRIPLENPGISVLLLKMQGGGGSPLLCGVAVRSKPLWTFLMMDPILLLMEEMEKLMKAMDSVPETRSSTRPLQPQKRHHHPPNTPMTTENHQFENGA